ncbi:MAG: OFA family MFS transporter [Clostridiaceae bacterium]
MSKGLTGSLHWTSKQASLPYTSITIFFVISMVIFGKIQDEKGPRYTVTIGSLLMGTGLILSGLFTDPKIMILTMGVIAGAGMGAINASTTPPAVKWFPLEKKGMVTGIVVGGVGISSVFYSPLANYLINTVGISNTFIYIGIGALIITLLLAQLLDNPPKNFAVENNDRIDQKLVETAKDVTWREMLKTKNFYKLWIMLALSSSAGLMIVGHVANITKVQVNWEAGFILVMLLSIFNALGRILGGTISDKIGRLSMMKVVFIMQALNMFSFHWYTNVALLSFGVALTGLCYGAGFSVFPATATDLYGMKNFGLNYGLVFTGWGVGGIIGPMTAAAIFDATNSYNLAYTIAGALLILTILIAFTFKVKAGSSGIGALSTLDHA